MRFHARARLIYAEKREHMELSLTRYPTITVGEVAHRYAEFFPGQAVRKKGLTNYRSSLTYDIEVTHAGGQVTRLSRIMGQTSGGGTQTPFYLTITASFVQLYHIGERSNRQTILLVAFDEAFSKMDQDRIGATLDLFQQFGLQVITATPLEHCEVSSP